MDSGYVIDHCIAAITREEQEKNYKYYVTDALKYLLTNTGSHDRIILKNRFYDIINPKPEETRTSEEIINSIFAKLK